MKREESDKHEGEQHVALASSGTPGMSASRSASESELPSPARSPWQRRRCVNWRSLLIGLACVTFICGLTPYNDYVLNNTFLVGNFLPVGLLLFFLALIVLVNAPLSRWWPAQALSTGELAVALGMALVSCALPSSGLMRYLPGHLIGVNYYAEQTGVADVMDRVDLPEWILPRTGGADARGRADSTVSRQFIGRVPGIGNTFAERFAAVPWGAWMRPAIAWGILLAALYGAVIFGSVIVRRQWAENERLPFPLAAVYLSLIDAPEPGHAFNDLFRSRSFWIAAGAVFVIHGFNALHQYSPKVPLLPIGFDFRTLLADGLLSATYEQFRMATLYFSIVGITFFLQSQIAFSLWFFFVLANLIMVAYASTGATFTEGMRTDQWFGALVVFALSVIWIGREQWALVARQMWRGRRGDEPGGRYLSYRAAGWGLTLCGIIMIVWLWAAGATPVGSLLIVAMLLTLYLAVARVVAETGLPFVQIMVPIQRPWIYAAAELPAWMAQRTTLRTFFYSSMFYTCFGHDMRECLSVYSTHALRINDVSGEEVYDRRRGQARGLLLSLAAALAVGFLVSGASTLYVEYAYASTLDQSQSAPINPYGVSDSVRAITLESTSAYVPPGTGPQEAHSRWGHFATGAGLTSILAALRLRYVAWPLHPVGYLLAYSYPMRMIWFSVFVGWLAKVAIVRFGGGSALRAWRSLFIGLIIGEAAAASFWLLVSLARYAMGLEYHAINLLPG